MILAPNNLNAHLASSWMTGIAIAVLGVGLYGINQPLLPLEEPSIAPMDPGENILVEAFNPPSAEVPREELIAPEIEPCAEIEIPPLPPIEKPLSPPKMAELTPVGPIREAPPSRISPIKPEPSFKPRAAAKRAISESSSVGRPDASGESGAATLFSGDRGRFPSPSYPAVARSSGLQGTVKLLVIVQSNGTPGSVSIESSSGHASLDSAASSQVRRRWRWPAGDVRRYIVPIRFVLQ